MNFKILVMVGVLRMIVVQCVLDYF